MAGANLNRSGSETGILTALEASNLDLWGTKLVTLSACDSGVGEILNGEGVYGLRRAFLLAGAESVVMSLWPVSDYATREMMTSYYKGLRDGLGRSEALRQTELAMLKRKGRRHPFYWASFIESGEWANLEGQRGGANQEIDGLRIEKTLLKRIFPLNNLPRIALPCLKPPGFPSQFCAFVPSRKDPVPVLMKCFFSFALSE